MPLTLSDNREADLEARRYFRSRGGAMEFIQATIAMAKALKAQGIDIGPEMEAVLQRISNDH